MAPFRSARENVQTDKKHKKDMLQITIILGVQSIYKERDNLLSFDFVEALFSSTIISGGLLRSLLISGLSFTTRELYRGSSRVVGVTEKQNRGPN